MNMVKYLLNVYVVIHVLMICVSDCKLCELLTPADESKTTNTNTSVDRTIRFQIMNCETCWINTTEVFLRVISAYHLQRTEELAWKNPNYLLELRFDCHQSDVVQFLDLDTKSYAQQVHLHMSIIFNICNIELSQLEVFMKFGTIVLLNIEHNSLVYNSERSCLDGLNPLMLSVQTDCIDTQSQRKLFWEECQQIFTQVTLLAIQGCFSQKMELKPSTLQHHFPILDTLYLDYCKISDNLYFPWNEGKEDKHQYTNALLEKLRQYVKQLIPDLEFPENSLWIKTSSVQPGFLHLDGKIDALTISHLDPPFQADLTLFKNISIQKQIVITDNNMKTIDSNLFESQSQLVTLDLHDNRLTSLTPAMLKNLKKLRNISLKKNEIKIIGMDPFETLYHLEVINLANNGLRYFTDTLFRDQVNSLRELHLNGNPLQNIPLWPLYSRPLQILDLNYAHITGESIMEVLVHLNNLDARRYGDYNKPVLDLSHNNITTMPSGYQFYQEYRNTVTLLTSFSIKVTGNPFVCNCNTKFFRQMIELSESKSGYICASPPDFKGREIAKVFWYDQYCPVNVTECPNLCTCFKREGSDVLIIDCRNIAVKEMPESLPQYELELWFQNSSISEIYDLPYLVNVTVLNLGHNRLEHLTPHVINKLTNVKILNLRSNHLVSIPIQICSLNLSKISFSDNPFICDCRSKWMKTWLLESEEFIPDWTDVKCLDQKSTMKQLIAVPDSSFVCINPITLSVAEHVFLPSVVTGSSLLVLVILSLISYFYRFNLKVLLFIHFKLHPFDKEAEKHERLCLYDAVLINCYYNNHCQEKIISYLNKKGYNIADIYRNSLIGYSLMANIEQLINHSKRVILYMSEDSVRNHMMELAWCTAYEKAVTGSLGSIILIADKSLKKQQNLIDSLKQFLKNNHFIDRNGKLLEEKIEYLMPRTKPYKAVDIELENHGNNAEGTLEEEMNDVVMTTVLVSYPDDKHKYVKDELVPFLTEHDLEVKFLDMEFSLGADIRDELPGILDASHHIIFILSEETLTDEVKTFILTQIITKAQLENCNYLLLCTSGQIAIDNMTNDLSKYIENYVTISVNDAAFKQRLVESIRRSQRPENEAAEHSETIPLL